MGDNPGQQDVVVEAARKAAKYIERGRSALNKRVPEADLARQTQEMACGTAFVLVETYKQEVDPQVAARIATVHAMFHGETSEMMAAMFFAGVGFAIDQEIR